MGPILLLFFWAHEASGFDFADHVDELGCSALAHHFITGLAGIPDEQGDDLRAARAEGRGDPEQALGVVLDGVVLAYECCGFFIVGRGSDLEGQLVADLGVDLGVAEQSQHLYAGRARVREVDRGRDREHGALRCDRLA